MQCFPKKSIALSRQCVLFVPLQYITQIRKFETKNVDNAIQKNSKISAKNIKGGHAFGLAKSVMLR